jgi:acyl-coenzyme A thioesterase 13
MASITDKSPEHAHVEELVRTKLPASPIYAFLLSSVQIVDASKGHVVARLKLTQDHMNHGQSLHGSVSATIVDWMGGMAVSTYDLRSTTGVSVDIHVTYQSGAKAGEEVEIEGIADRVGSNLAFTKVTIYKYDPATGARGKIVIAGTHTKFVKGSEVKTGS